MSASVASLGDALAEERVPVIPKAASVAPAPPHRRWAIGVALVLGAGLVASQAVQAWSAWQLQAAPVALPAGTLCSLQLVNGQVYYGELVDAGPRHAGLRNVYYVQAVPANNGAPPGNRLMSRRKGDWHAPTVMTVPVDKVLMIEAVGADSRLAELIRQDQATPSR